MIVDTSAIVAIFLKESGFELIAEKLLYAQEKGVGAPTLVECGIVLSARQNRDVRGDLSRFIKETDITIIPFTEQHYGLAVSAWLKYGKGRHQAALNFGDCLTYATAKAANLPLLFVGDDFTLTDITPA